MYPKDVVNVIKSLYPIKRTLCIEGSVGLGKSTVVRQAAKELGVLIKVIHMPTALVEDFGIPYPTKDEDYFGYKLPHWWPKTDEPEGILLFDDRNQVGTDLQKVLANICQDRTLHGSKLPDGWMIISTGNRIEDRAGSNKILTHLRNRETVIQYETSLSHWIEWALANNVSEEVIGFINFRPNLLNDFNPDRDVNPTPRSWVEGVDRVLTSLPKEYWREACAGAIGQGATTEFIGYLDVLENLQDLNELIKDIEADPNKAALPTSHMLNYAVITGLSYRVKRDNLDRLLKYIERINKEFVILFMTLAKGIDKNITKSAAYVEWLVANQDVVL